MSNLNIITVIAIILFARLGVRLFINYKKIMKEDNENMGSDEDEKESDILEK